MILHTDLIEKELTQKKLLILCQKTILNYSLNTLF